MSTRFGATLILLGALTALARAAEPAADGVPTPAASAATPTPSPKRALPDYDGRGNYEAEADHWALWLPRGLLGPLYVVHEYVLRKPIGALVTVAERDRWLNTISELFSFGPRNEYMLIPTVVYDFGFRTNGGLRFSAEDLFAHDNSFVLHLATAGTDWWIASARDRYRWNDGKTSAAAHLDLVRRPDLIYLGTGPEVRHAMRTRYGVQRLGGGLSFAHRYAGLQLAGEVGVRHVAFRDACCDERHLEDAVAAGEIEADGYGRPYTVFEHGLEIALDSRRPRPAPGTGARADAYAKASFDPGHDRSWIKYGGALAAAVDLTGRQRILRAQLVAGFVDPMQGDEVPFTELASMDELQQMRGFSSGWMVGRSTIDVELGYSWPVAFMLDSELRLSVGNAFGRHLEGFAVDKLRMAADIGITTIGARDSGLELLFGVGSGPFDQDFRIDSVRFAIGSRRGI